MKKLYRIFLLLIAFVFLSTYNPNKPDLKFKESNTFFKIKNIKVTDNSIIKKSEIYEKLNHVYNKNIFLIKSDDIENPLKELNFFLRADVKKKYPDTIILKIFETKPIAVLFKDKNKYLLDSESNLVSFIENKNNELLPSVFGKNAENNFINFFNQLEQNNFPIKNIKNFYYFQIGRWDVQLFNNKIIKFPSKNISAVIEKSIELLKRKDFSAYNIIDLRIDGKIIVE